MFVDIESYVELTLVRFAAALIFSEISYKVRILLS